MTPLLEAARSFARTHWMSHKRLSRAAFEKRQARALQHWLKNDLPQVRAFEHTAQPALSDLPIMDKARLMADFASYNTKGLSAEAVRAAIAANDHPMGLTVGA
ncbi:MAG: CoF synthetase, partial [Pseudomonadota bacterium]